MTRKLALIARDAEDLEVISSLLQDAIVPVNEMTYVPEEGRFVLIASRFSRDRDPVEEIPGGVFERVNCALRFERVAAVKRRNLDPRRRAARALPARHPARGGVYRPGFFRRQHDPAVC